MEEKFVITPKECRRVYLRLYAFLVYFLTISCVVAAIIVYFPPVHGWFYLKESTTETPHGSILALAMIFSPLVLLTFYLKNIRKDWMKPVTMGFITIFAILMGCKIHLFLYFLGWKTFLSMFAMMIALIGFTMMLAIIIKKDFSSLKKMILYIAIVLLVLIIIVQMFRSFETLNYALNSSMVFIGLVFVFVETQDLRRILPNVHNQINFERIFMHSLLNLFANLWLMLVPLDNFKVMLKIFFGPFPAGTTKHE